MIRLTTPLLARFILRPMGRISSLRTTVDVASIQWLEERVYAFYDANSLTRVEITNQCGSIV